MRKLRVKIKEIKSKLKVKEVKSKPISIEDEHQDFSQPIESESKLETIESKTKSPAIPVLGKTEKGETVRELRLPEKNKTTVPKDQEHIFTSYERFGMSEREKKRVYSQDLRNNSSPIGQSATLVGSDSPSLSGPRLLSNQNTDDESSQSRGRVGLSRSELSKYDEVKERYRARQNDDD